MYKLYASFDRDHFQFLKNVADLEDGKKSIAAHKNYAKHFLEPKPRTYFVMSEIENFLGLGNIDTVMYKEKWSD